MKKKIDNLGRIIIPMEVRRSLNISVGEELNMEVEDNKIILTRQIATCAFCDSEDVVYKIKNKGLCEKCYKEILNI